MMGIIGIAISAFNVLVYPGLAFLAAFGMLYFGMLRKLAARMQGRIGPPVWQPLLDVLKLFGKQSIVPEQAKTGFMLWPIVALAAVFAAGVLTPVAGITGIEVAGGFIVLVYFLSMAALAIYLAGFSSANPYGTVGSMRGIMQMLGYEFPFIASLAVPIVWLHTLSPAAVNGYQLASGLPWLGMVFPFAAFAYFLSVLAKVELPPFHVPDAHQEIVSGYATEYSGFPLAALEMARMVKLFVLASLGIAVFLGGSAAGPVGFIIFIIKSLAVLFMLTLARVLLARVRIDHVVRICWIAGAIALIDLVRVMVV